MNKFAKLGKIESEFENIFLDNVEFDGLSVDFAEVDADGGVLRANGNIEGTIELMLRHSSVADFIKSRGGKVGEDLVIDSESEEVTLYVNEEDSACVAVDCSVTLRDDMSIQEARKAGLGAANSVNKVIKDIIDYSKSKKTG